MNMNTEETLSLYEILDRFFFCGDVPYATAYKNLIGAVAAVGILTEETEAAERMIQRINIADSRGAEIERKEERRMIHRIIEETTKEFDGNGKLIKETFIKTEEKDDTPYIPYYPWSTPGGTPVPSVSPEISTTSVPPDPDSAVTFDKIVLNTGEVF